MHVVVYKVSGLMSSSHSPVSFINQLDRLHESVINLLFTRLVLLEYLNRNCCNVMLM